MVSASDTLDEKNEGLVKDNIGYPTNDVKLIDAPPELEDEGQVTIDELVKINLESRDDPNPTFLSAQLSQEEKESVRNILIEYIDCFSWSYKEMSGLDIEVIVHKLAINPKFSLEKQTSRKIKFDLEEKFINETKKLIEAGFIREEKYPDWITSIVPVKKNNG